MKSVVFAAVLCISLSAGSLSQPAFAQAAAAAEEAHIQAAAKIVQRSIDASRKDDFDKWIACFSTDAFIEINGMPVYGREELRRLYNLGLAAGAEDIYGKTTKVEVLDSGWTGQAIYVRQLESYSKGIEVVTYVEYFVEDGKIVTMLAAY